MQAHRDLVAAAGSSISGADFALTTRPLITGQVFADTNGNGKKGASEKGLAGVTVYVDLNHDGKYESNENSKVTDANGNFSFAGLNPGTYTIRVKNPTGFAQTTPAGGFQVTVAAGQSVAAGIFGEKHI
jgi:protocatechuate 3,4-dioxygenase beta subunit